MQRLARQEVIEHEQRQDITRAFAQPIRGVALATDDVALTAAMRLETTRG